MRKQAVRRHVEGDIPDEDLAKGDVHCWGIGGGAGSAGSSKLGDGDAAVDLLARLF